MSVKRLEDGSLEHEISHHTVQARAKSGDHDAATHTEHFVHRATAGEP
jgi:hypothetical protein